MEKKIYIKPSAKAYMATPVQIISTSPTNQSFSSGGPADPSGGRAKKRFFDTVGDSDDE